jgi:hypothetical protein
MGDGCVRSAIGGSAIGRPFAVAPVSQKVPDFENTLEGRCIAVSEHAGGNSGGEEKGIL